MNEMIQMLVIKKKKLLDLFIISNFFFLALDIVYAHSINNFAHWGEWIPLSLCLVATVFLGAGFFFPRRIKSILSIGIGATSIFVGLWGVYFHLESQFFQNYSLKSLIYTAPFVAPLSFTALGFLLFLNLLEESSGKTWAKWIIFLAYLGFLGNYVLSLCDHEQNGFFYWTEWIPVFSAALVLGIIPYFIHPNRNKMIGKLCYFIVGIQAVVGILGAVLHVLSIFKNTSSEVPLLERILYGAPIMAPLLYTDLAFLLFIGMISYERPGKLLSFASSPQE